MILIRLLLFAMVIAAPAATIEAQVVHEEFQETLRAEVLEIVKEYERDITGTDATALVQEVRAQLIEGDRRGEVVSFENDLVMLGEGDTIFLNRTVGIDGVEYFNYKDIERRGALAVLFAVFVMLLIVLSGWQGIRALLSLALSIGAIFFILVPALLAGYSAPLVSLAVAGLVLALVLFLTHGINPRSIIAFLGTLSAVAVTCAMAAIWVSVMKLTGLSADAAVYLNFATGGTLDFAGLLLGSIIIGILGVLDDVSITQSSVVQELKRANPALSFYELYASALRVGRDHVGSLVNTLAFAYVGMSLPLVLLLAKSSASLALTINQEMVAAELLRIIVGSIGLVLAIPFTTFVAAWYFKDKQADDLSKLPSNEGHDHSHHGH